MPPKPADMKKGNEYYNIDFSLNTQLRLAGAPHPPTTDQSPRKYLLIKTKQVPWNILYK